MREAVAVAKHLERFPNDGVAAALENILAFDAYAPGVRAQVARVFQARGVPLPEHADGEAGEDESEGGAGRGGVKYRDAGGRSLPKTGLGAPKHGKEDAKNEPHVGGNTWAGGTGGSDTAGLGGRGGPYRLDKGHVVHQVGVVGAWVYGVLRHTRRARARGWGHGR